MSPKAQNISDTERRDHIIETIENLCQFWRKNPQIKFEPLPSRNITVMTPTFDYLEVDPGMGHVRDQEGKIWVTVGHAPPGDTWTISAQAHQYCKEMEYDGYIFCRSQGLTDKHPDESLVVELCGWLAVDELESKATLKVEGEESCFVVHRRQLRLSQPWQQINGRSF